MKMVLTIVAAVIGVAISAPVFYFVIFMLLFGAYLPTSATWAFVGALLILQIVALFLEWRWARPAWRERNIALGFLCGILAGLFAACVQFEYLAVANATPGQTPAQLTAWGKANPALPGFIATNDDNTGGTDYTARTKIGRYTIEFHSEPQGGIVHREYVSYVDMSDAWNASDHLDVVRDTLRTIYGSPYALDFDAASRVYHSGRLTIWRGKRLAYATFAGALFVERLADLPALLKNAKTCGAIDCED